jgi:hypothetical protein
MSRLHFCLRLLAVAVAFPAILLYILAATLVRSIREFRSGLRTPLAGVDGSARLGKGIPVGYSYWEHYEAPVMLDEIVVHHDE